MRLKIPHAGAGVVIAVKSRAREPLTRTQVLLGLAIAVGLVVRLAPILRADFPIGDGGLFVTMARDLRNAGFVPPAHLSYNGADIPFAYPPLGVYILAAMPGDPISTERWLPLVWSLLAIGTAYLLASEFVDQVLAALAALIFAFMPVTWAIEGGGVIRGLGFALLLCALWRVAVALRAPSRRSMAFAGVTAGLAMLSHPAVGPTGMVSALLLFAWHPSCRRLAALITMGVVAGVMILPWLLLVWSRYGPGAFATALVSHASDSSFRWVLTFGASGLGVLDFVLPAALVGIALALRSRLWIIPAWLVLMIVIAPPDGRFAALAWALLAALAIRTLFTAVQMVGAEHLAAGIGLAFALVAALAAGFREYAPIPSAVRTAMVQAGRETSPNTRFAVVVSPPPNEPELDWFPVLAQRASVGTYMGLEWTSESRWWQAVDLNGAIQGGFIPPDVQEIFRVTDGIPLVSTVHAAASEPGR